MIPRRLSLQIPFKKDQDLYKYIGNNYVYITLLQSFPRSQDSKSWISITPSMHKLLGHSWELIKMNNDRGLKNWDECGLEANNKILREVRLRLSRKTCQQDNLEDVINRLWLISDPKVNCIRTKLQSFCTYCNEHGHFTRYCKRMSPQLGPLNEDDALFAQLLM